MLFEELDSEHVGIVLALGKGAIDVSREGELVEEIAGCGGAIGVDGGLECLNVGVGGGGQEELVEVAVLAARAAAVRSFACAAAIAARESGPGWVAAIDWSSVGAEPRNS